MNANLPPPERRTIVDRMIWFCLDNKLVTVLIALAFATAGIIFAPFDWEIDWLPRDPVAVDAIPDIGENQQIVYTDWMGRSPQDMEDQVTYPLTVALLGIPKVKSVRSYSMFGFSSIYVIFEEGAEFYWTRSRVLEKLSSLPPGTLPEGVRPALGPDATALGQVYWYTLEGRDEQGRPTGGWDPQELRSIQDWNVRYALSSVGGVAEVASIGGFVKEYQIDVDPAALVANDVMLEDVYAAVRKSNLDVGARTVEINRVEYMVRGLGFLKSVRDLESAVVRVRDNVPVRVSDVARVTLGPALRTGMLDKEGVEATGGVVVARYGENPLKAIKNVKKKIAEIAPGLPRKTLSDGRVSQVSIVPFYDRTGLIYETLGTLNNAIYLEVLITILVIMIMVNHLGSSVLISSVLPLAVLTSFIGMKLFHVDANIVSLSGIAIAIGTIVDMGIVLTENMLKHLDRAAPDDNVMHVLYRASSEVGGAILTAVSTTIVSFLPVFMMTGAEGKLFKPLAYTKTFALAASIIVALTIIPTVAHFMFEKRKMSSRARNIMLGMVMAAGIAVMIRVSWWIGLIAIVLGARGILERMVPELWRKRLPHALNVTVIAIVSVLLIAEWAPMGVGRSFFSNGLFCLIAVGAFMLMFRVFERRYSRALGWLLDRRWVFVGPAIGIVLFGAVIWLGFSRVFFFLPGFVRSLPPVVAMHHGFPGLGKEFMPPLDEGSFLYMPTTMAHASIGAASEIARQLDLAIKLIPEVEDVVGKVGRVESALDPAPVSMFEIVVTVKAEYVVDKAGRRQKFRYDRARGEFARGETGALVADPRGRPFRQWRPEIKRMDDLWDAIVKAAQVPGATSAPRLQPIQARIVMLQSGMRAPMGVKVKGPSLDVIEEIGVQVGEMLKLVPSIEPTTVIADRVVGKPYLEIEVDRDAIGRHGLSMEMVQDVIEVAVGGRPLTTTVEGRERYAVRVRYMRELRGDPSSIERILVSTPTGAQVPLGQLARVQYRRGPDMIKSEETFLTSYVLFDMRPGFAEVDVVEQADRFLKDKIEAGELVLPAGASYAFAGSYENQVRSEKRLAVVLPLALFLIFLILYFQFKSVPTTSLVFSGILLTGSGGFILVWLYGQGWFLDLPFLGENLRDLFQMHPINLSVAIWVGFLALFGIATDDAVLYCTYLDQRFATADPRTPAEVRALTVEAASRRIRPALMTSATTILALLPVFTSTGRGSDVMIPMAIPSMGGMLLELLTCFQAPVLYCWMKERKLRRSGLAREA